MRHLSIIPIVLLAACAPEKSPAPPRPPATRVLWEMSGEMLGERTRYAVQEENQTGGLRWITIEVWERDGEYIEIQLFEETLKMLLEKLRTPNKQNEKGGE